MKLNKKTFLITALLSSIGVGVYYMGKAKIMKMLVSKGLVTVGEDGKYYLTENDTKNIIKTSSNKSIDKFDYNNPAYHASADYYLSDNAIEKVSIKLDTNNNNNNSNGITIHNSELVLNIDNKSGNVEPSIIDSVAALWTF